MAEETMTAPPEAEKMEEAPVPSTSAEQVDGDDVDAEANRLMGTGRRHLVMKDIRSAVNAFQEASSLLGKKYGETADQCADAFYYYGTALLDLARMENNVLGNALEGIPEEEDEECEKEDPNIPSASNLDEKEREQLREQVYDAMAEKEEKSDKENGETKNGEDSKEPKDEESKTEEMECEESSEASEAKEQAEGEAAKVDKASEDAKTEEASSEAAGEEKMATEAAGEEKKTEAAEKSKTEAEADSTQENEKSEDKPKVTEDKPEEAKEKPDTNEKSEVAENPESKDKPEAENKPEEAKEPEVAENPESKDKPEEKKPEIAEEKSEVAENKPEEAKEKPEVAEETKDKPEVAEHKPEETKEKPEVAENKPEEAKDKPEEAKEKPEVKGDSDSVAKPGEAAASEETEDQTEGDEEAEPMEGDEEEGAESEDNEETEEKENEEEEIDNLQLAWEMLDLSKIIFKRQQDKEAQLKAAEAHLRLGEVSIESENYTQAIEDFLACLTIQKKHLEEHDRLLAETHYQLGLAYQYSTKNNDAISHFTQSIDVIEKRLVVLKEQLEKATEESKEETQKEMDELQGLLPDIKEKIEDSKEAQKTSEDADKALKETLGGTSGFPQENGGTSTSAAAEKSKDCSAPVTNCVSDISHLVRKKRKPEEESPLKEAKKLKSEPIENGSGNGDAVVPSNEQEKTEAEKPTPMETAAVESSA